MVDYIGVDTSYKGINDFVKVEPPPMGGSDGSDPQFFLENKS